MTADDLSGQILDDRYRVIEPLGEGAMGSVFRAERLKLGRIVAIKVMNERLPDEMASRKRFEREATTMAKLEHPHCASVLDIGVHNHRPYVVMDFVSGANLTSLIDQGPVPIPRAIAIAQQVLSGLAHAHELGIVHRDIKPANIVLSQKAGLGDHVKILDFGLARLNEESSNLTGAVILGTPSYMAPEQIRGILIDGRADLYACGVMLFELLTGVKPFRAANNDPLGVCMMHLNVPAPRLADKLPGRDFGALEDVIARALQKDRDRRFATAAEFAAMLVEVTGRTGYATPPAGTPALGGAATEALPAEVVARPPDGLPRSAAMPPSRRGLAIGATLALVAAIVIGVVVISRKPAPAVVVPLAAPSVDGGIAVGSAPADDPVATLLAQKPTIDQLQKARRTYPRDARLPYEAGRRYLERMYFADGLPLVRTAIDLDPTYRRDDALIKLLVRGFNATATYDATIARFLHDDIGPPARPYLDETARDHPNPIVRARAATELRRY